MPPLTQSQQVSLAVQLALTQNTMVNQTQNQSQSQTQSQSQPQERRRGGDRRNEGVKTRIVIVDGHTLFRRGVRNILELEGDMEVIGEAGNGREARRAKHAGAGR